MTLQEAKNKLNDNFGSIYSKQDVLDLLDDLELPTQNTDTSEKRFTAGDLIKLKNNIIKAISNLKADKVVDYDSIELSISYDNKIEIDNMHLDTSLLESVVDGCIDDLIDPSEL